MPDKKATDMYNKVHKVKRRVYSADTDAGQIVYHANYLNFAEMGRIEFMRWLGYPVSTIEKDLNVMIVVRHAEVSYYAPARLDDELTIQTRISKAKRTSIEFDQLIYSDEKMLASVKVMTVCVNDKFKPTRIPAEFLEAIR